MIDYIIFTSILLMLYLACFIGGGLLFFIIIIFLTPDQSKEEIKFITKKENNLLPNYYDIREQERKRLEMEMRYEHITSRISRLEGKFADYERNEGKEIQNS